MTRPITFPKDRHGDFWWTNRETGVRVYGSHGGYYVVLPVMRPSSSSLVPELDGLITEELPFREALGRAKQHAEQYREKIAQAHAEALTEYATVVTAAAERELQALAEETPLTTDVLDRADSYINAAWNFIATDPTRAIAWAREAVEEIARVRAEPQGKSTFVGAEILRARQQGLKVVLIDPKGGASSADWSQPLGSPLEEGDVVTIAPKGGRQFEVMADPSNLLDGMIRVSPRNPRRGEDGPRWVSTTYVRRVPADQVEPIEPDEDDESGPEGGPKFPPGTPEYKAYATELRAELRKFARGDAPYEYDKDPLMDVQPRLLALPPEAARRVRNAQRRLYPGPY